MFPDGRERRVRAGTQYGSDCTCGVAAWLMRESVPSGFAWYVARFRMPPGQSARVRLAR